MEDTEITTPITTNRNKTNFNIAELMADDNGDKPTELVVVPSAERHRRPHRNHKTTTENDDSSSDFALMSDAKLNEQIKRWNDILMSTGPKLPDKGEKVKNSIEKAHKELQRRQLSRRDQENLESSIVNGDFSKNGRPRNLTVNGLSKHVGKSEFAFLFDKKLDGASTPGSEQNTAKYCGEARNAYESEIASVDGCNNQKQKARSRLSKNKRATIGLTDNSLAWEHRKDSYKRPKYGQLNFVSRPLSKENQVGSDTLRAGSKSLTLSCLNDDKEGQTVVLVDEEEPELLEEKQEVEVSRPYTDKIYYPSREDPESLEIFHSELKCLEPGQCLTSTIMNFYIRFLRESYSEDDRLKRNVYFFNTYFYSKLQEAMARQKSEREAFFTKFRRWWKGVNIFEKAYIFLPINEDNHWSLVIICIPDEEESLIILHLDSLGLHYSSSIFKNIKSLLINEWEYLKEDGVGVDVPIPDSIWNRLSRKIFEKIIEVPRQTNDYDCGLFVLYYMERFIQDQPGRLKKGDLTSKFGKKWFRSQEASSLRGKIKKILKERFHKAVQEDNAIWEPVCLPADSVIPAKTVNCVDSS